MVAIFLQKRRWAKSCNGHYIIIGGTQTGYGALALASGEGCLDVAQRLVSLGCSSNESNQVLERKRNVRSLSI